MRAAGERLDQSINHQIEGIMTRKASAVWQGDLKSGRGTISTSSGVLKDTQYSFSTRFENGTGTNPEELVGAAHAGCFSMALSAELGKVGVTPERIESVEPDGAVVSFVLPDAQVFGTSATNVMAKFCHFIFFFSSRSSGERWVAKHPGTFLYSLDDAFALAKRFNARNFGPELLRRGRERQTP